MITVSSLKLAVVFLLGVVFGFVGMIILIPLAADAMKDADLKNKTESMTIEDDGEK